MSKTTKNMLKIIGEHFLFAFLSLFLVYTFTTLLGKHLVIISIVTAVLHLSSNYSAGWSLSGKDYGAALEEVRLSGDSSMKPNYSIYKGFIIALPNLVLSLVLIILAFTVGQLWEVLYRFYNYAYIYLILDSKTELVLPACIIVSFVTYISYGVGYIFGKSKKVFLIKYIPKMVYTSKKK